MIKVVTKIRKTRKTPIYNVGIAARLTGLPIWTIRWIEKHGLIKPRRTEGNQRLFSEEDIELLNRIRELLEERVNLPGIRVILSMRVYRSVRSGLWR